MPRPRPFTLLFVVLTALAVVACGDDEPTTPTSPTPTSVTETFSGTITVNGARTEHFSVQQTGTVTASLIALEPSAATVGMSLGTWNTTTGACQVIIAKDDATLTSPPTAIVGNASAGEFCVRLHDVGLLTETASYTVAVVHF